MIRGYMLKAVNEHKVPLTDTLIDLLHAETDLGVKNQLADAIKVLLDPQVPIQDPMSRAGADFLTKLRSQNPIPDTFVQNHFDESAKRLFLPLKKMEPRQSSKLFLTKKTGKLLKKKREKRNFVLHYVNAYGDIY